MIHELIGVSAFVIGLFIAGAWGPFGGWVQHGGRDFRLSEKVMIPEDGELLEI